MAQLLILDSKARDDQWARTPIRGRLDHVLSFHPDAGLVARWMASIQEASPKVQFHSAAGRLDNVADELRVPFSRMISAVPDRYFLNGKPLKQKLTFEGKLSLWWLSEMSMKRSDASPAFTRACQIKLVQEFIKRERISAVFLFTEDADFWDVMDSCCRTEGIELLTPRPRHKWRSMLKEIAGNAYASLSSIAWLSKAALQTAIAKVLHGDIRANPLAEPGSPVAFYTHYPGLWKGLDQEQDEKYAGVPAAVHKISGKPVAYACTFSADGVHQSISLSQYWRQTRWLKKKSSKLGGIRVYLVDADLNSRDFFTCLRHGLLIARAFWKIQMDPKFKTHLVLEGINFFPLFKRELRQTIARTPRYILHALRVRRFVRTINPSVFVMYHFEFCYGRAMVYGAKTATSSRPLLVVGAQHGPISKRKLLYHHFPEDLPQGDKEAENGFITTIPTPDKIVVEGPQAKVCLGEGGYPESMVLIGGAPRITAVFPSSTRSIEPGEDTSSRVLVVLGQHDGPSILDTCLPILKRHPTYKFLFKPHPRSSCDRQVIQARLRKESLKSNYEIVEGPVITYLHESDAVVATYSSVAMEAYSAGIPVVCLQLPDVLNVSPLMDDGISEEVQLAKDSLELEAALEQVVNSASRGGKIRDAFFQSLGSQAETRWAEIITDSTVLR